MENEERDTPHKGAALTGIVPMPGKRFNAVSARMVRSRFIFDVGKTAVFESRDVSSGGRAGGSWVGRWWRVQAVSH